MATLLKALLTAGVIVLAGCGETSSSLSPTAPASAIIVLPGYYGTRLAQVRDHNLVWISTWEALFGSRSLILPLGRLGLSEGESNSRRLESYLKFRFCHSFLWMHTGHCWIRYAVPMVAIP